MPHLHLNIFNANGDTPDEEGADFADVANATDAAFAGIRSLLSAEVLEGELNLHGRCEIADGSGRIHRTVTFEEVVRITGP